MSLLTEPLELRARHAEPGRSSQNPLEHPMAEQLPGEGVCGFPSGEPAGPLWVSVKAEEVLAALVMAALALITLANVITRYLVDISLAFTEEYSIVLLMVLIFLGVSSAVAKNTHIKVTFFLDLMRPAMRRWFEIVGDLAMLVCLGVLAYCTARSTFSAWQLGETSPGLGHPQWVYLIWLPLLSVVAMLRVLGSLIRAAQSLARE